MSDPDLVMAYRLLYYVYAISLIPDDEYDRIEKLAREEVRSDHGLNSPGSDRLEDYEPAVRALALYLRLRYSKREKPTPKPTRLFDTRQPKLPTLPRRKSPTVPPVEEEQASLF